MLFIYKTRCAEENTETQKSILEGKNDSYHQETSHLIPGVFYSSFYHKNLQTL